MGPRKGEGVGTGVGVARHRLGKAWRLWPRTKGQRGVKPWEKEREREGEREREFPGERQGPFS